MKVKRNTLLLLACLVWSAAGINILRIGLMAYPAYLTALNTLLSILVFAVFQRFIFGKLVKKPTLGDDIRKIEPEDISRANRLMYMTAWLALFGAAAIKMHRFLTPDDGGAKR